MWANVKAIKRMNEEKKFDIFMKLDSHPTG